MTRFVFRIAICIAVTSLVGCKGLGSVRVVKNPGEGDNGIRYYRPKPYLLVEPADPLGRMVKIKTEQLPDYSEEYSIHTRGRAAVQLKDGWNLVAAGPGGGGGGGDEKKDDAPPPVGPDPAKVPEMVVAANNVPIGYYESVFDTVGDRKYLKGWRYIGFAVSGGGSPNGVQQGQPGMPGGPDPNCPVPPSSSIDGPLYGLVFFNGVMTFREIGEIAGNLMCPSYVMTPKPERPESEEPEPASGGSSGDVKPGGGAGSGDVPTERPKATTIPAIPDPSPNPGAFSRTKSPTNSVSSAARPVDDRVSRTMAPVQRPAVPVQPNSLKKASAVTGIPMPKDL